MMLVAEIRWRSHIEVLGVHPGPIEGMHDCFRHRCVAEARLGCRCGRVRVVTVGAASPADDV